MFSAAAGSANLPMLPVLAVGGSSMLITQTTLPDTWFECVWPPRYRLALMRCPCCLTYMQLNDLRHDGSAGHYSVDELLS